MIRLFNNKKIYTEKSYSVGDFGFGNFGCNNLSLGDLSYNGSLGYNGCDFSNNNGNQWGYDLSMLIIDYFNNIGKMFKSEKF